MHCKANAVHSLTEVDFRVVESEPALQNLNHEVNGLMTPRGVGFAHEVRCRWIKCLHHVSK